MPGFTVPLGFPYPLPADPTDGPQAMKDFADAVDASVTSTLLQAQAAASPPAYKLVSTTPQPLLNTIGTFLTFDTVVFDNTGLIDLVANPTTFIFPSNGTYIALATATFAANNVNDRFITIVKNAAALSRDREAASPNAAFPTALFAHAMAPYTVADTIHIEAFQNSGATLNVTGCSLAVWKIGP